MTSSVGSGRSKSAARATKARDGNTCLLTGVIMPEAAHVFAFSAAADLRARKKFAKLLWPWGKETCDRWTALFSDRAVTESPRNLLSLGSNMHEMWDKSFFALKPISATQGVVTVQFFWLKRNKVKATEEELDGYEGTIKALCGGDTCTWGPPQVAHRPSGLPIQTGQLFEIRARDQEQLPSMELLQVQWYLRRIAAICAAGGT